MNVDALILAGGSSENLGLSEAIPSKALLKINGKPMIQYVLEALQRAKSISRKVILIPRGSPLEDWSKKADEVLFVDGPVTENIALGIKHLKKPGKIFIVSSDIPLLSSEAVEDFLLKCQQVEADIYYPIIPREACEAKFPGTKRTYMRLKDGTFTGGNIHLLEQEFFLKHRALGEKLFSLRKSPLKLIQLLGLNFVLKLLLHRLTIREVEEKTSKVLSAKVAAVKTEFAEIGVDVDKKEDLLLVKSILAKNK